MTLIPASYCILTEVEISKNPNCVLVVSSNIHAVYTRCPVCDGIIKINKGNIICDNDNTCGFNKVLDYDLESCLMNDTKESYNNKGQ